MKSHDESLQDSSCEVIQSLRILSCAQLGTPFLVLAVGNVEGAELATKYYHNSVSSHEPCAKEILWSDCSSPYMFSMEHFLAPCCWQIFKTAKAAGSWMFRNLKKLLTPQGQAEFWGGI